VARSGLRPRLGYVATQTRRPGGSGGFGVTWGEAPPRQARLLLTRREAAEVLGVSLSHFQRHIQMHLRCVYSGQLRLYRPDDLERWAERSATDPSLTR
jgi:excisionase family DNA binding protein